MPVYFTPPRTSDAACMLKSAMADLTRGLETAMAGLERARADLEAATLLVGAELAALQARVSAANTALSIVRETEAAEAQAKRQRSSEPHPAAAAAANPDEEAARVFAGHATDAEERLQSVRRALAPVHDWVHQARASVDGAAASTCQLLAPARLAPVIKQMADTLEARNEAASGLVALPAIVQLMAFSQLSVVQLWRARRVSRHFHRQATEVLETLPRLVSVGGALEGPILDPEIHGSEVEVLDMSTMLWSSGLGAGPPPLPAPRAHHALAAFSNGRIVAVGGSKLSNSRQAVQWVPGSAAWTTLPDTAANRTHAVAVALPDGRLLVAGGEEDESAEVLAADGSGWSSAAPMTEPRGYAAAGLLPSGHVIVAGGYTEAGGPTQSAEKYYPAKDMWSVLPAMTSERDEAAACVLADGRFATVGGRLDEEEDVVEGVTVFDPTVGRWQPLPSMTAGRAHCALVAVAGGMIAIGGAKQQEIAATDELYDIESGRWLTLPHAMRVPRDRDARVVLVPASALA